MLWLLAVPVHAACPTIVIPSNLQFDRDEELRDHLPSDEEISVLSASNSLPSSRQNDALLAILSETEDLSATKLAFFAKHSPALVVPVIAESNDFNLQCLMVEALIGHWISTDMHTAMSLIKELHLTTLDDKLLRKSVNVLARIYPAEALELAHEYLGRFGYVLESIVLQTVAEHDPKTAIELIPRLRKKFYSYTTYTDELSIYKPLFHLGPEYAVEFGRTLSAPDSESYFWSLSNMFCDYDPQEFTDPQVFIDLKHRIVAKDTIPRTSYCILREAHGKHYLTEEQFELLYGDLDSDDRKKIDEFPRSSFIEDEAQ